MTYSPRGPLERQPDEVGWWQASDGRWYPPESSPGAPMLQRPVVLAAPTPARGMGNAWWLIVGAGAVILGSFMPWATVTAVFVGTINASGVQGGDGWIAIALAVPLLVFGIRSARSRARIPVWWTVALGLLLITFSVFEVTNVSNKISSVNSRASGLGHASVGYGLWLVVVGAIAVCVGAVTSRRSRPTV
jgi:hypothetical protein